MKVDDIDHIYRSTIAPSAENDQEQLMLSLTHAADFPGIPLDLFTKEAVIELNR